MKRAYVAYKVATLTLFAALAWGCCATVGGNKVCVSPQQVVTATPTAVAPRPEPRVEPSALPTDAPPTASPTKAPTAAPTSAPTATTTPTSTWSVIPPSVAFVNGGNAQDPRSMGPDGKVGFTVFYRCPGCGNWPADQDHAHWTPPAGDPLVFVDDQGHGHAAYGACSGNGDSSDQLCKAVKGRAWDPTCASVGSFITPLSGNVTLTPLGNCYEAILSGHGEYQVCLRAGAKACADPRDYMRDEDWVNGCTHGEVLLTDHAVCSAPIRVDR